MIITVHRCPSQELGLSSGANMAPCRLLITPTSLLERTTDTYDVIERRPLTAVAALVRFMHEPKLLAVEWSDGRPPSVYVSVSREPLLATLLDAAQVRGLGSCFRFWQASRRFGSDFS